MDADALIQSASAREELACDVYCQFQTFDADHSGHLGFRELGLALRQLFKEAGLKKSPDFNTLEESFGAADTDGDNKISLEEFVAWYNHTIEWTARLHAEEAQEEEAQEAKKEKPATTLGRTESKLVFDLKMHDLNQRTGRGNPGPDTPRSRALTEASSSLQRVQSVLAVDRLPHLTDSESRRVRDLFMQAVSETDKAIATSSKKSGKLADRQYETQQASPATAQMSLDAYVLWSKLAYGKDDDRVLGGKSAQWVRERCYAIHCQRAGVSAGALTLQGMLLLLRPALRGTLEQVAASAFTFYDLDGSGLLHKAEVMKMIELQPIGSDDERDLLHLITFTGSSVDAYGFEQYLAHAEAFGLHGSFTTFRERMLDKE